MKITVHLMSSETAGTREVTIPDCIEVKDFQDRYRLPVLLDEIYRLGQNEMCIGEEKNTTASVSMADVIELPDGRLFVVGPVGFKQISIAEIVTLASMPRRDRQFSKIVDT